MVAISLSGLASLLSLFGFVGRAASAPVSDSVLGGLDNQARGILERSKQVTPAAPVSTFSLVVGFRRLSFCSTS